MRRLLAFLVLATALPMIFLLAYSVKRESELEIDRAHRLMSAASDAAAADALLFLADQERALARLAKRPIVREMNPDNCDPSFEVLTMLRPYLANVATADMTGLSVCSVLKPANGVRPRIGDPLWLAEMRQRNAFVTGRPQRGIYTGRWILVLAYPVHDDQGSITGALEFVVNLTAFNAVVAKALPQGMTGILDQDGTLLASSIDPGQWVGQSLRELALFKEIQAGQQGWVTSPGADGVERLWAVRPIGTTGWTVVSGIASDSIHAEVQRSAWRNGLLGLVILAVSGMLVLLISRRITTPLWALRGLERQVALGQFDQRVPVSGPLEIADMAAGFNAMLDQLQAAELKLRESEAHYRTLFDASPDAIRVICNDRVVALNLAGQRMFGVDSPDQLTDILYGLIDARFHNEVRARFRAVIEERNAVPSMEQVLHRPDGVRIDVEVTSVPFDYKGAPAALSIVRDITSRKLAETALRESESRYARVIEGSDEGFWDWDLRDHSFKVSPRFESMLGFAPGEWQVHPAQWPGQVHPEDLPAVMASLVSHIKGLTDKHEAEMRVKTRSGEWKWVFLRGKAAARDAQGMALIMSGTHTDISERKQAEALIWQQANTDALTGLPNRRMLRDRLDQAIRRCKRDSAKLAVLFIDLDLFKEVNDTLGHDKGDLLLVEAAHRIGRGVRESDTVARQGGDEFTVILPELDSADCTEQIAQSIVSNLAERFQLGDEEAFISASVGIALYPDDATDIEGLLKSADQALYAAKAAGRNRFSYFTPALQASAQLRMRLTNDLHHALAGEQLEVFYQPIVDLATGAVHKAEALLRWQHPSRGSVSPAEFIPLAESSGLIIEIGDWVFRQAAQQVRQWRARYHPDFQVSVNTSPVQFADGGLRQAAWPGYLAALGLPGQSLVVEITEGMLLASKTEVMTQLNALRSAGIGVSLDDFGTGYSSLSYLQKYAIDFVKIDQSFVRNLVAGGKDMALCKAIIVMAHELGMQVVAEGIETPEQRTLLAAAGCDHGQGDLFARPLPVDELEALLAAQIV